MHKTGSMELKLHYGAAPFWLITRMVKLAKEIFTIIVDEFGVNDVLRRLSDPIFFQACSNVLGFDWDSSGSTTVTASVLKRVFHELDLGIKAAGGKGRHSRKAPTEIDRISELFNLSTEKTNNLKYASKMSAKVDNTAIQAGYQLYHHMFFVSETGEWTVVQQGVNPETKTARRFHWFSSRVNSFVEEPHIGIVGDTVHRLVLDMTAKQSSECRKVCTDLVAQPPEKIKRQYLSIRRPEQSTLKDWFKGITEPEHVANYKIIPEGINWKALQRVYDVKPSSYEKLLSVKGIGPTTVRGLALISELIYGEKPSWRDPVKFSFAFGGKDGVPYPVDRQAMDRATEFLRETIKSAKIGEQELSDALKRLRNFAPKT